MDMKLELVNVPVSDVDRAVRFYREQVGFVLDHDTRVSDEMRIVQLTPPGSARSIALSTGMIDMVPGSLRGLQLVVPDIEAVRTGLAGRDVEVSPIQHFADGGLVEGHGGDQDTLASFRDPDGNEWTLQERPDSD